MKQDLGQNPFFSVNIAYIEELYQAYLTNPSSVSDDWALFFNQNKEDIENIIVDLKGPNWKSREVSVIGNQNQHSSVPAEELKKSLEQKNTKIKEAKLLLKDKEIAKAVGYQSQPQVGGTVDEEVISRYLEDVYVKYSHLEVSLDPLGFVKPVGSSILRSVRQKYISNPSTKAIVEKLDSIYLKSVAYDFNHLSDESEIQWIKNAIAQASSSSLSSEDKKEILKDLTKAEMFENQIHVKFPGAKRFSVEGGEVLIPALEQILKTALKNGTKECVFGMAHRGRLNVLTHTMGKPYKAIFAEFAGVDFLPSDFYHSGDVKYHMGYSNTRNFDGIGSLYVTLTPNPSHLEAVNPVVMGKARCKQDSYGRDRNSVLPILIHGDAAMAGQGVVYESFAMANLSGYTVGGTVHVSIDNQVGFTASWRDTRASNYSTEVAKTIGAPVFHVNSSDVESVIKIAKIVADYRSKFGKDVVLDIICYRKYGHNEGDEPMFTQPVMYSKIKDSDTPDKLYADFLASKGVIDKNYYIELKKSIKAELDKNFEDSKSFKQEKLDWLKGKWSSVTEVKNRDEINNFDDTFISEAMFKKVGAVISGSDLQNGSEAKNFKINKKIEKLFSERLASINAGSGIDWATAELMAYGSLVCEGYNIRLSGEDCERGTFSHRHSVIYDQDTNKPYNIFSSLFTGSNGVYEVYNSLLSEFGVLGYEYGYSIADPNNLVIWEAQFGDFSNGAATIYDQFISSGEDKWLRMSGIVSLLPHGFEGQGPEHSSARLERFLQYCAKNNIIVANITTPANLFHALRRQLKATFRKPLIIMSPKSLLRHPSVISSVKDFTVGSSFKTIIGESLLKPSSVKKVVLTSGKVYYDLFSHREKLGKQDEVAIIRVEQYYPFDSALLKKELSKYTSAESIVWLQEEPKNMGAWSFIRDYIENATDLDVDCVSRPSSPSPATGYYKIHNKEQEALLNEVFGS